MFCVVQVLQLKKPDTRGDYREYRVSPTEIIFNGTTYRSYSYGPDYGKGRFERPHREAYKVSIHESHRVNGKVVKKQCVIGTISYYELIEWTLDFNVGDGIERAKDKLNADYDTLYTLVENKMKPIIAQAKKEFHKTEEYKARQQREKLQKAYQKAKKQFAKQYGVDPDEYDHCYNIFGELMEPEYLAQIIRNYEARRSYRNNSYQWSNSHYSNYSSSYSVPSVSNYTADEKDILKQFYRSLTKQYHPDLNPGTDTTAQMQMLNKLKEEWGV